jgi:hypothetical protein
LTSFRYPPIWSRLTGGHWHRLAAQVTGKVTKVPPLAGQLTDLSAQSESLGDAFGNLLGRTVSARTRNENQHPHRLLSQRGSSGQGHHRVEGPALEPRFVLRATLVRLGWAAAFVASAQA